MKYLMSWTFRVSGSARENEETVERALALFSKWSPSPGVTIHQFVQRIDNVGGFSLVESDNPVAIAETTAKFSTFAEYAVYPVIDVDESVNVARQACEFRESVS